MVWQATGTQGASKSAKNSSQKGHKWLMGAQGVPWAPPPVNGVEMDPMVSGPGHLPNGSIPWALVVWSRPRVEWSRALGTCPMVPGPGPLSQVPGLACVAISGQSPGGMERACRKVNHPPPPDYYPVQSEGAGECYLLLLLLLLPLLLLRLRLQQLQLLL